MRFLKYVMVTILGAMTGVVVWFMVGYAVFFVVMVMGGHNYKREMLSFIVALYPVGVPLGAVVLIALARSEEIRRKREKWEDELRSAERARATLYAERASLAVLLDESKYTLSSLKELVASANAHLDEAEREFEEGALAPFWDKVEYATDKLAAYCQRVITVEGNATDYAERSSVLSDPVPGFDISISDFADARPVAKRLSYIVRKAQKNFEFSVIYEQRRTSKLIYSGFGSLAQAITDMEGSISEAISDLSVSIGSSLEDLGLSSEEPDALDC